MQIEVTQEEALILYSQRYSDSRSKMAQYLPLVILVVALMTGLSILYWVQEWLGVAVCGVLTTISIAWSWKQSRASHQYARSQIKEM